MPSWENTKAYTSTVSSIRSDRAVPSPWPELALVRSSTTASGRSAAWSRAVIFRDCIGSTRGSFAPVRNSTAGYLIAVLDVVVRRIGVHGTELLLVLDRAELGDVERPVRRQLHPQHVVNADVRHHALHQVRVLRHDAPMSRPPLLPPSIARCGGRGVLAVDQVLEGRGEVVEHVLLVRQVAGRVPCLAVLAAAAEVDDRDDEAVVEQHPPGRSISRLDVDAVAAVAGDEARIGAVELRRSSESGC